MTIGKTLKLVRITADVSQRKLARDLGVTPGFLSLVENGKRQPTLTFLNAAAERFRIPAGFLMLQDAKLANLPPKHRKLVREIRRDLLQYVVETWADRNMDQPSPNESLSCVGEKNEKRRGPLSRD